MCWQKNVPDKVTHIFKVVVLGDAGAGKTSIINRYVTSKFHSEYNSTVGVEFFHKTVQWDHHSEVRLHIWDIPGKRPS